MLRFTIRDVLWLTLVVGLAVGWAVDRAQLDHLADKQSRFLEEARMDADALDAAYAALEAYADHQSARVAELEAAVARPAKPD